MKKNPWEIFQYLFVLILSSCTSCNEPIDPTVLPAETDAAPRLHRVAGKQANS